MMILICRQGFLRSSMDSEREFQLKLVEFQLKLHEFARRIELSLAKKRTALRIFLDIVRAFDNATHKGIADALQELEMSPFLVHWIENLLRHCTVQVELNGEKVVIVKCTSKG